jgi:hypothetical protein
VRATPAHGKVFEIQHKGTGVFRGINGPFKATRYHSLVVDRASMPFLQRLDRLIGVLIDAAQWLALPLIFLLFLQWPLREILRMYSREAKVNRHKRCADQCVIWECELFELATNVCKLLRSILPISLRGMRSTMQK